MDQARFKARIAQIFSDLEAYSYYELLKVEIDAGPDEIRSAFHRMALSMHPDRYQGHADQELRQQLYAIYKRVAEGYRTLMDPRTRQQYDEGLAGGARRLVQTERRSAGPKAAEDAIDDPQARAFFRLAEDALRRGDLKSARLNYKFAADLVGDHPLILERVAELDEREAGDKET